MPHEHAIALRFAYPKPQHDAALLCLVDRLVFRHAPATVEDIVYVRCVDHFGHVGFASVQAWGLPMSKSRDPTQAHYTPPLSMSPAHRTDNLQQESDQKKRDTDDA